MNFTFTKNEKALTIGFIFLLVVIFGLVGFELQSTLQAKEIVEKQKQEFLVKKEKEIKILVSWVLDNSQGISRKTATEIVMETQKTKYPLFLLAIFSVESNFNPSAVSNKGAMGIGQIMPMHSAELIKNKLINETLDLYDVSGNIISSEFLFTRFYVKSKYDFKQSIAYYLGEHNEHHYSKIVNNYFDIIRVYALMNEKEKGA